MKLEDNIKSEMIKVLYFNKSRDIKATKEEVYETVRKSLKESYELLITEEKYSYFVKLANYSFTEDVVYGEPNICGIKLSFVLLSVKEGHLYKDLIPGLSYEKGVYNFEINIDTTKRLPKKEAVEMALKEVEKLKRKILYRTDKIISTLNKDFDFLDEDFKFISDLIMI